MRKKKSETKRSLSSLLECMPCYAEQSIHKRQLAYAQLPRKQIQIIRLDAPTHYRTEQLAYPKVRKLLNLKATEYYQRLDMHKKLQVNQKLSKSVNSLYSRLSNQTQRTVPPLPSHKKQRVSAERRRAYERQLLSMVQPVCRERVGGAPSYEMGPQISARLAALAKSRWQDTTAAPAPKPWQLTACMRKFKPTGRLLMLSKCKPAVQPATDPWCIKQQALKYKISARLQDLAAPATYRRTAKYQFENDMSCYEVSRAALRAKVGQRVGELAQPRGPTFDHRSRSNPYEVSPAALKAKLTQRLHELARPKLHSA